MAGNNGLPPEERLPEENPAPAPGIYPPPEEGSSGNTESDRAERGGTGKAALQKTRSALLLAAAGAVLCGVMFAAPMEPDAEAEPPSLTSETETDIVPTELVTTETEPAVLTDAERLVSVGTWKNSAASEWVHFNESGTGWWYDGTYFGRMVWEETDDGGVTYEAGIAYLGAGLKLNDEHIPENEGDCLHSAYESGSIDLLSDEDRFTCPGLRFGAGSYLPDDTMINAAVMDGICGKTAAELASGSWHMQEISDLGVPVAPSLEGGKSEIYTDLVYVQSLDFSSGSISFATRNSGLLWREDWTLSGDSIFDGASDTLDTSFTLRNGNERAKAILDCNLEIIFGYFSDLHPGDIEYNNMHFLWGRNIGSGPTAVYLLITSAGVRLGIDCIDLYPDNYTLLAQD